MRSDRDDLGLQQPITRRDFIGGVATAALIGSAAASEAPFAPANGGLGQSTSVDGYYPPILQGLRGQYPGSFEIAHAVRDGQYARDLDAKDIGEHYDLVVVGAGISGLAAAHFYRRALGDSRRVMVLDNHDDFGGHAKRNEFWHEGKIHLSFGGSMSLETPFPYSFTAKSLLGELGVDPASYPRYQQDDKIAGLGHGIFFDREHFRLDRVVSGYSTLSPEEFFARAPLTEAVRRDLIRIHTTREDFFNGMSPEERASALKAISYQQFLLERARLLPASLPFFFGIGWNLRNNKRVDTCPAYEAWRAGCPGFGGMSIAEEPRASADYFHFPDGNATIARLLVSRLVPSAFSQRPTAESIVLARLQYETLDVAANMTRIRLNSTVVRVAHLGARNRGGEQAVSVTYSRAGKLERVTAANVIMACFNHVIPFLVPELPEAQKTAMRFASKVPMQVTNVLLRNRLALQSLKVMGIHAPNGYHTDLLLDEPVGIGGYASLEDPSRPAVVQLIRNPNKPGLPRRDQNRAGRAEMLATPFETIEYETRAQLQRMLGPAGFDARRDILGLTVNRWPHGYAYTYDSLGDPEVPDEERPHVIGRRPHGRITIANSDSGAGAFVNVAIDQAERAVSECLASRGLA